MRVKVAGGGDCLRTVPGAKEEPMELYCRLHALVGSYNLKCFVMIRSGTSVRLRKPTVV